MIVRTHASEAAREGKRFPAGLAPDPGQVPRIEANPGLCPFHLDRRLATLMEQA